MVSIFHSNPTQILGVISFGLTALLCLGSSQITKTRYGERSLLWLVLSCLNLALCIEVVLSGRHHLHNFATVFLQRHQLYQDRYLFQLSLLLILGVIICLCFALYKSGSLQTANPIVRTVAAFGSICSVTLFLVETLSLHDIDAFFYQPWHNVLVIGWMWFISAMITSIAALTCLLSDAGKVEFEPGIKK